MTAAALIPPLWTRIECKMTELNFQGCSSLANPEPPREKASGLPKLSTIAGTQDQGSSLLEDAVSRSLVESGLDSDEE